MRGIAGLVAGLAVSVVIGGAARTDGTAAASSEPVEVSAASVHTDLPVDVTGWGIGALRMHEARQAVEDRRNTIVAASRSGERPSLNWPAEGPLSGWYGERRGSRGHVGVDVDGDTGDPIVASGAGVVEWAGPAPAGYGGYGLMVLIRHGGGVQTLYAHLSHVAVAVDDVVEAGDHLGAMGTTGNVTGSHLHFEVRLGGTPVDPRDWLPGR